MASIICDRFLALRPYSFPASLSAVVYGLSLAGIHHLDLAILTVLCTLTLHAAINIANDYFDFIKGVDSDDSKYKSYVASCSNTSARWHLNCFIWLTIISVILGGYIVAKTDWVILLIGVASIAATYFYSGGPKPLANMALGEFLSFFFFGPVACCGTYYIQTGNFSNIKLLSSISIGVLVSCIMLANNIRDIETDKAAGKITIAVRLGHDNSIKLYLAFIFIANIIPVVLGIYGGLLTLPYAIMMRKNLNVMNTTMLVFIFGVMISVSLRLL